MNLPLSKVQSAPRRSIWRRIYHGIFGGDALGFAGAMLLAVLLLVAIIGPLLVTHDPLLTTPKTLLPPSSAFPFCGLGVRLCVADFWRGWVEGKFAICPAVATMPVRQLP